MFLQALVPLQWLQQDKIKVSHCFNTVQCTNGNSTYSQAVWWWKKQNKNNTLINWKRALLHILFNRGTTKFQAKPCPFPCTHWMYPCLKNQTMWKAWVEISKRGCQNLHTPNFEDLGIRYKAILTDLKKTTLPFKISSEFILPTRNRIQITFLMVSTSRFCLEMYTHYLFLDVWILYISTDFHHAVRNEFHVTNEWNQGAQISRGTAARNCIRFQHIFLWLHFSHFPCYWSRS